MPKKLIINKNRSKTPIFLLGGLYDSASKLRFSANP